MQASLRLSSSPASKRVIAGVSSTITRSCYRARRGKAHAAAPLSAQESPKGRKRITKEEKRVRIEEFVEKYRASNEGKFPTSTTVRQQFGGSHYTVREVLQELEYNYRTLPLEKPKAAQLHETVVLPEHFRPKDDNGSNSFDSHGFKEKQNLDDMHLPLKDTATSTESIKKAMTETWRSLEMKTTSDSSVYHGGTDAAKQDLMNANGPTVSDQTESDNASKVPTEALVSLELKTKSDPSNHQGEVEVEKLGLNSTGILPNASGPTVSDRTESGKMIKAEKHYSEHSPKHGHEGSTKTSLLGNLKYIAHGIRNFWKKL